MSVISTLPTEIAAAHDYSDTDSDEDSDGGRPSAGVGAKDGSQNEQLAVGYRHDRSFVVRGNNIGVFKHTDDDQLKFSTAIRKIMTPGGKAFAPKKVDVLLFPLLFSLLVLVLYFVSSLHTTISRSKI